MINLGLENLYKEKGFEDPAKKPYQIKTLGHGFSNLRLGPPKIIIETLDDNHTNILYRVHLKSGVFATAVDGPGGAPPEESDLASVRYVVNDWYFTFQVDLGKVSTTFGYGSNLTGQQHKLFSRTRIPARRLL